MVKFSKTSPISGKLNTREFDMDPKEFDKAYDEWEKGEYIQVAFSDLNDDEREFIMSGTTPEEWEEIFGE